VTDAQSESAAGAWWEELTGAGGEGMVVKPMSFTARGRKGIVQPGIKCRGREYLRIIYGPEYADPSQIDRLRDRSLGRKRSLAIREFGLGVEALERFTRHEPLYRVHECVFGVLALESEPVDPRL
jgi:protein phosphatase